MHWLDRGNFFPLLISSTNNLDPVQANTLMVFLKEFFEKVNFEKRSAGNKMGKQNYSACKELVMESSGFLVTCLVQYFLYHFYV